ncbi:MAG: ATP-binding protein [bacterium]
MALALPLALFFAGVYAMASLMLLHSYEAVEERDARQEIGRCTRAVSGELERLRTQLADWSASAELAQFADDPALGPARTGLTPAQARTHADIGAVVDVSGTVIFAWHARGQDGVLDAGIPPQVVHALRPGSIMNMHSTPGAVQSGLLTIDGQVYALASGPIVPALHAPEHGAARPGTNPGGTHAGGTPVVALPREVHGVLLIGRRITEAGIAKHLSRQGSTITLTSIDPAQSSITLTPRLVHAPEENLSWWEDASSVHVQAQGPNALQTSAVLGDVFGRRSAVLTLMQDRPTYAQAVLARNTLLWAIVAMAGVFVALLMRVLSLAVLGPVQRLGQQVMRIGERGDLEAKIELDGSREIKNLGQEINKLLAVAAVSKRQAEEALASKSQFLANTSHEIRTPLNGVVGSIELLLRSKLDEKQLRHARMARFSCEALMELINDILDLSKIEARAVELEVIDIDLRAVVEDVGLLCNARAAEKGLRLETRTHPCLRVPLRGDPLRLHQVLVNLVSNATKFTEKGAVAINASADRMDAESVLVRFTVTDTGMGIPPQRIERLFKSFSQVDAGTTRKYGGTGLGLSICRQLVELMGGQIGVTSEPGRGSTFWFTVPLARANKSTSTPALTSDLRSARILIVAPAGAERERLVQALNALDFRTRVIGHPEAAPEAVAQASGENSPFTLLLAWAGFGQEALEGIADLSCNSAAIGATGLMLTGPPSLRASIDSERLHNAAWLEEPFNQGQLLDAIAEGMIYVRSPRRDEEPVDSTPSEPSPAKAVPAPSARILLVEDNEVNQVIAVELLQSSGYNVVIANNGQEAVKRAQEEQFDLVLMDCQMPVLDGFEATRAIRALEEKGVIREQQPGKLPIIALTANALSHDKDRCTDAGMDAFITKPLDPAALFGTIERLLIERGTHAVQTKPAPTPTPAPTPVEVPRTQPEAEVPILDRSALLRRCMNRADLAESILAKFCAAMPKHIAEITGAAGAGDLARTASLAHALKGATANLGAERARQALGLLETAAKAGDAEGTTMALREAKVQLQTLLESADQRPHAPGVNRGAA